MRYIVVKHHRLYAIKIKIKHIIWPVLSAITFHNLLTGWLVALGAGVSRTFGGSTPLSTADQ